MKKTISRYVLLLLVFVLQAQIIRASQLPENKPLQDVTKVVIEDLKDTYYLGPIGARGWIQTISTFATPDDFEGFFSNDIARQILITAVEKGSPADGVLEVGDVIVGTGDRLFSYNARKAIADAIDEAEKEENKGVLHVLRWRPDVPDKEGAKVRSKGKSEWVELKLKVMGTYSETAPYNCSKSEAIARETAKKILEQDKMGRLHVGAIGLLATGEGKYTKAVKDYIYKKGIANPEMKLTVEKAAGSSAWSWSYAAILLSEYYLLTGDEYVLPAIKEYAVNIAKGQSNTGNWGHKMADYEYNDGRPHGRLTGYSALNQPGLTCFMAMNYAVKCGIESPELTKAIDRASEFFGYYCQKGAIPYGYDRPLEYMLTNNGTSGTAAIAFALKGDKERASFFTRLSAAGHVKTEVGHTGTYFNIFWTPLAANLAGPETTAEFFKEHRWINTLARRWNGGFVYQPPGGRFGGSSESYYGLSSDGAYLAFYTVPRKKLYITGKDADESMWFKGKKAKAAVKASMIEYDKRSNERLLQLLKHPVPMVRRQAADELTIRRGDFVGQLTEMLNNGNYNAKVGATHGLGALKERAAGAVNALVSAAANPKEDLWVRNRAVLAISSIGDPAQKAVEDLLKILLADKPEDTRGDLDKEIAIALTKILKDPYKAELDENLFYSAIRKMLGHPHHVARNSAMKLIRNIPLEDFHLVADNIVDVIRCDDFNYHTYHNDADRAAGMAILERLNIDAVDLCMETLETNKWGQKWRVHGRNGRLATLVKYGAAAKRVLPELKKMRSGKSSQGKLDASADKFIEAIENSEKSRKLMSLDEAKKISKEMKFEKDRPGTTKGIIDITNRELPADAVILVGEDGYNLIPESEKVKCLWKFEDGVLTASPLWDSLITKEPYKDFRMHVEFNVNDKPDANPEANGNSGVYIQQRYEIQILNSHGVSEEDYTASYNGSLYRLKKPDKLVSMPAGQWQSYDIAFRAARFDGDKKVENARITVYQNGELIHDDFSIPRKTGVGKKEGPEPLPIKLQGHKNEVQFRNVWIQELNL